MQLIRFSKLFNRMSLLKKFLPVFLFLLGIFAIPHFVQAADLNRCSDMALACRKMTAGPDQDACFNRAVECLDSCPECNLPPEASTSSTAAGPALDAREAPEGYANGTKTGVPGILPNCAFYASGCDGENANINLFIDLGINIAKFIFSIIGTVSFIMFVYGGFTMILSFGSAEKFSKGKDILVAAVVGMIIAFGAYLIVGFILKVLQVGSDFKIINQ